jgi:hypothetical protein
MRIGAVLFVCLLIYRHAYQRTTRVEVPLRTLSKRITASI